MRKFLLAALLLLFLAGASQAAPSTAAVLDSTIVSLKVLLNFASVVAPESAVTTYKLWYGTTEDPQTLATLPTTATFNGSKDTVTITDLYNGAQYYWEVHYWTQDTTTGSRHGHDYWIAVGAGGITKTIGQTILVITDSAAVDKTYRNFRASDVWFSDSTLVALGMQYRLKGVTSTWTWATVQAHYGNAVGRDSVQLASPDTLCALSNGLTIDLEPGRTYEVRVIGYWGTAAAQAYRGSDTSNTLTVSIASVPGYTPFYNLAQGEIAPGVWHFKHAYANLNDNWSSPKINVRGYNRIEFEIQKFGWDNNHPADSSKVYLMTDRYSNDVGYTKLDSALFNGLTGGLATAATGVMALPDTGSGRISYTLSAAGRATAADSAFYKLVDQYLYLNTVAKDSAGDFGASLDATTLDSIYYDCWAFGKQ